MSNHSPRGEPVTSNFIIGMLEVTGIMFLRVPIGWRLWAVCMLSVNVVGSLLFWDTIEGKMTFCIFMTMAPQMGYLYSHLGFVKALGLGHALWIFLVPWIIWERLPLLLVTTEEEEEEGSQNKLLLQQWLYCLVAINSISLLLDVNDVHTYVVHGKTEPTVVWKKPHAA